MKIEQDESTRRKKRRSSKGRPARVRKKPWLGTYPCIARMDKKKELELLKKYKEEGDLDARNKLVEDSMWVAGWYTGSFKPPEHYIGTKHDLFQAAIIGIFQGIDAYDMDRGDARLGTYLAYYVKNCVRREVARNAKHEHPNNRAYMPMWMEGSDDRWAGDGISDISGNDVMQDEYHIEEDLLDNMDHIRLIEMAKDSLTRKQWEVFRLLYGRGLNEFEIARLYGVSRQRINQIKCRIHEVLRRVVEGKNAWKKGRPKTIGNTYSG